MGKMTEQELLRSIAAMRAGADGVVRLSDVVVPAIFDPYVQQITEQKSRIIQSGVLVRDAFLDNFLAGAGSTINVPGWKDLDNDEENYSNDDPANKSSPKKIGTATEVATRMNRNQSWSSMDLTAQLIARDPMTAIGDRIGAYWARRMQTMFLQTVKGIFADNAADPTSGEHEKDDLTHNIAGAAGTTASAATRFNGPAFIDTLTTIGDSEDDLGIVIMHSIVFARAKKNNLIAYIPDATGQVNIPTYMGRTVIVDDGMAAANTTAGVYETWVFGAGAFRLGVGTPEVPTEMERVAGAGNGSGQTILHNRVEWSIHPVGHAYTSTPPQSGPTNAQLADGANWKRVYAERKMIKIARLITREA